MEALLVSMGVVALAEIGDKTQVLTLVLAARYRQPLALIAAIFLASVVNHSIAGVLGAGLAALLAPELLRWLVGIAFVAMAAWVMVPDKLDADGIPAARLGVFGTAFITFFLAEMADKTQFATVALVVQFETVFAVVAGTTLGMMIANVPVVLLGKGLAPRLPLPAVKAVAAAIFLVFGLLALGGAGERWGL
ncbi:MAG: TMEM165/GDT1 family protein [Gammaproteobacteria bacterium]